MNIVIGSGPAGVACAKALLERGQFVHMLDGGLTLEPERAALASRLQSIPPNKWTPADLADYQSGMNPDVGGVPLKLIYGSDFAYRRADEMLRVHYDNAGLRPSLAKGGLSNVWGAAMLPFIENDITDWPVRTAALAPHYSAVLQFTGLAATRDALENVFPLYTETPTDLRLSNQARRMLDSMEANRQALADQGIQFGRSRVAVRGNRCGESGGCCYCRLCMYGCPYGYIYTSADTLNQLQADSRFKYEPNVVVNSVRESGTGVELAGVQLSTGKPLSWQGNRVFIAAGTIATTRLLLQMLGAYEEKVWLKDSQYFLLPLVLFKRVRGATVEPLQALSQLFIEFFDSGRTSHVQIYSNSDLVNEAAAKPFGPLRRPLAGLIRNFQERLLVAQGFLHSDFSSRIAVQLRKENGAIGRLELKGQPNPDSRQHLRTIVTKLRRNSRRLGAFPLSPMLKIAEPGRSFHAGGSFPMSTQPGRCQTDILGRVSGSKRVHAVDATIFPSIPATTITFSTMANAHRIGWEAALLKD